ncbi:MAG: hypothetical protein M1817_001302 [Caeruleum heppii]|nr:MAG: hypothetical protein M1817_001302 [Caeruleum heppii]
MAINPQVKVSDSFDTAASLTGVDATEMRNLYARAVKQNPWLGTATVLDAFSTVIGSLHTAGLAVILDNHVSHASWCCSGSDGNGWWKSPGLLPSVLWNSWNNRYFDTDSWIKSLTAMASFASTQPGVVGMSLRNELRTSDSWYVARGMWKEWVSKGANAVNTVDPSLLVIIGGLDYATDLSWVYNDDAELIVPNRTVWEFHWYSWSHGSTDCGELKDQIGHQAGFLLTQGRLYTAPLWLSEFGSQMSGDLEDDGYLSCVVDYMSSNDAEWAVWALQGSYYIRDGNIDADEQFGVMTRDWSGWRNSQLPKKLGSMWNMTQGP